ncbi:Putative uncharacterized protein [Thermobacillus xylanilyticus]|jgi:hypothetical protein|uniref:Uncharacterized protein n=1 Tax=Thermobacillus xylanilyticus TaxID=76633 RepID=A0ABM8UZN3_THEXY|nr:hypothetical protein [Thermobacillus xylanilyticus]REJ12237.1 MAG: hypothetical protein C6W59_14655 [Paenibacillaceae bacterium]CAG5076720.1 Putative uncharacterized protein [Thermobacillus xylanilyticus]
MIPFERTWPYDRIMGDLYVQECPFCKTGNVILPIRPEELDDIRTGRRRLLVFPCCRNKVTVIDADPDYLLTDTVLRGK